MGITIKGDNRGIAVDGDLKVEHLEFIMGKGVHSASGVQQSAVEDAVVLEENGEPVATAAGTGYPPIGPSVASFFTKSYIVSSSVSGTASRAIETPVDFIMHTIYDITVDWNPSEKTSARKWRLLYETLSRNRLVEVGLRPRYTEFVDTVIRYCHPDVSDTYNNNISKIQLPDYYRNWEEEDSTFYQNLKKSIVAVI